MVTATVFTLFKSNTKETTATVFESICSMNVRAYLERFQCWEHTVAFFHYHFCFFTTSDLSSSCFFGEHRWPEHFACAQAVCGREEGWSCGNYSNTAVSHTWRYSFVCISARYMVFDNFLAREFAISHVYAFDSNASASCLELIIIQFDQRFDTCCNNNNFLKTSYRTRVCMCVHVCTNRRTPPPPHPHTFPEVQTTNEHKTIPTHRLCCNPNHELGISHTT